ncbi:type I pullulanase [Streptococcus sp. 20-1249]|uniref:type I pullulanase n=1 Tax=Streptococcus hepaticus TaxID=3349163 RepID=UPI003749A19E
MALRQFTAFLDTETTIRLQMDATLPHKDMTFCLENETSNIQLDLLATLEEADTIIFQLESPEKLDITQFYTIFDQDRNRVELSFGDIVRSQVFDDTFAYDGKDLGATYSSQQTTFRFWAPISKQAFVVIEGTPHLMTKVNQSTWMAEVTGDLEGQTYYYLHRVNGEWLEVHDPYALSSQANSRHSYIINPEKFLKPSPLTQQLPISQAIIYEMSVRDFSQQAEAGFKHAGQFLGLTESPTLNGHALGFDYIQQLGVTHIQLMPLYDFGSVDETQPQTVYNWGYDPVQYNVPEGSFSTNPNDPYARILELQTAIQHYHQAGIGVTMDVVYNHVYNADTYAFERIVPGYFFRFDEKRQRVSGTFCGNDVASERAMVSRYIRQSLQQWVTLYGFDGFRFDLMGIIDMDTINQAAQELRQINPNLYLYGEGWKMATGLDFDQLAHQYNAAHLPGIAFFNDDYRDSFKKVILNPQRLIEKQEHEKIQNLLAGSRNGHYISPQQSLNYIECHDNATAFDYFHIENPSWETHQQKRAASFGLQLTLIAQGTAFLHSGQEFFRTKNEIDNSYNIPDSINRLDWTRAEKYREHVDFISQLIHFRKEHLLMTQADYEAIHQVSDFYWLTEFVLRYTLRQGEQKLQFIINFATSDFEFQKESDQTVLFNYPALEEQPEQAFTIAGQSICILSK